MLWWRRKCGAVGVGGGWGLFIFQDIMEVVQIDDGVDWVVWGL